MNRDEWDRLNAEEQDRFDRYGYPDPPWMEGEREWREEQEAFEREGRYFDAPLRVVVRECDDWLEEAA